ncbi:TIGR01906 family membrane protein [Furfurilactobacillus entadae]|uniref:TIGR01906 family membrane protein n=1 Tax=Furfurilactobacillus entadae TaxID=2922307 RepID=UPI0035E471A8
MSQVWQRLGHWFRYLCGWLFILTSAITLTVHAVWVYRVTLSNTDVLQQVGLTRAQMMHNYMQLLHYLNWPWVTQLRLPNFVDSVGALKHFADVKQLLLLNNLVCLVTLPIVGWGLWWLWHEERLWQLLLPMQIALPLPPVVAALMAVNFDQFFITFHHLLFRNNDWLFDPRYDPIINALPESFFLACFALFFVLLEGWLIAGYLVSRRSLR